MKLVRVQPDAAAVAPLEYARALNPQQLAVVTDGDGPCLVLAGAGSGKTRTLIYRVAYLLERGVTPEEIVLVTFTNKAAREMLERLEGLLPGKARRLWGGTFHHLGNQCLRQHAGQLGYDARFTILDREDGAALIGTCLEDLHLDAKGKRFPKAGVIEQLFNFATNAQQSLADTVAGRSPHLLLFLQELQRVQELYGAKKRRANAMDYNDLLARWLELLETDGEARTRWGEQFRYLLVDEYQDTNRLQYALLRRLSGRSGNLLVVGDDAQSIYSFRAADLRNVLEFPKDFPGARIFRLETNYRSTPQILELANESIQQNRRQYPKRLCAVRGDGPKPQVIQLTDQHEQSLVVADRIGQLREEGMPLSEIAVLFRSRYQAADLELELARRNMAYVLRGGVRFFEQAHVKDVLAHLRLLVNGRDELSWKRVLVLQPGLGRVTAQRVWEAMGRTADPVAAAVNPATLEGVPRGARAGYAAFQQVLGQLRRGAARGEPAAMVRLVASGYAGYARLSFDDAEERLEDLEQLAVFAASYRQVGAFVRDVTLREDFVGEAAEGAAATERLVLSTIHQAKGLEWEVVILIGVTDGHFPHPKAFEDEAQLEEERRLFYVAVTRARTQLVLTQCLLYLDRQTGEVLSRPSLFLKELPWGVVESWAVDRGAGGEASDIPRGG